MAFSLHSCIYSTTEEECHNPLAIEMLELYIVFLTLPEGLPKLEFDTKSRHFLVPYTNTS